MPVQCNVDDASLESDEEMDHDIEEEPQLSQMSSPEHHQFKPSLFSIDERCTGGARVTGTTSYVPVLVPLGQNSDFYLFAIKTHGKTLKVLLFFWNLYPWMT